jgi:nucleoside-triphosphatase
MKTKILLTGPPRCGKSTLILKLINYCLENDIPIDGFLTPEVREANKRIGFDIECITTKEKKRLARIGNFETQYKLGKYHIFIEEFESIITQLENLELKKIKLIIIDEIGKMELFSHKFQTFIKSIFSSNLNIIATIGQNLRHPLKDYLLNLPDTLLYTLTRENSRTVYQKILELIERIKIK